MAEPREERGLTALLRDFDARRPAALARAASIVENRRDGWDTLLSYLQPRVGRARRVGITGPPGAGKSTLTTRLVERYRAAGRTVGILAVDPTSTLSGGALLGDRIRMESVALDPGVYIRSMATRGALGGLAIATRDVVDVYDAFGFDRIVIETVGVGQSEFEVARVADTTVLVLVPESGDSVQTLKAGLMEIADVFVVNKADRAGAERLRMEIELMLGFRSGHALHRIPRHTEGGADAATSDGSASRPQNAWVPVALLTTAQTGDGVDGLMEVLDRHATVLEASGALRQRRRTRLRQRVVEQVEEVVRQRIWRSAATLDWLEDQLQRLERAETTPRAVAEELLRSGATGWTASDR